MLAPPKANEDRREQALSLLWELCEQHPPVLCGAVLADCFLEPARLLIDLGALRATTNATAVTCRACEEHHEADIEFDDRTRTYRQYCLVAGWVDVPDADLMRYEVDFDWLIDQLSSALNIASRPKCLVESILWDLGEARAGMRAWTGLFVRRLSIGSNLDRVFDELTIRAGKSPGLVLTTTEGLSSRIGMPGGHRLLPLGACARLDSDGLAIDHNMVVAALDRAGGRARWRTGMPGRPTAKHLYVAEHQRRINCGAALGPLADEAAHLHRWMQAQHPDISPGSVKTIENTIRNAHRSG